MRLSSKLILCFDLKQSHNAQFLVGGWGRRNLTLIGPEDDGYTGTMLKGASRGGKTLFIVPIQEQLCTDPLELNDEAFANMPKAMCQKCRVDVPLHFLTDHIKSCVETDLPSDVAGVDVCNPAKDICKKCLNVCISYSGILDVCFTTTMSQLLCDSSNARVSGVCKNVSY